MRKMCLCVLMLCFVCSTIADAGNLYKRFGKSKEIHVFLESAEDISGHNDVVIDEYKKVFADVLKSRINMKFVPVGSRDKADVVVSAQIKKYYFKEKVMPRLFSAYALTADMTTPKNLAKITVGYKVMDPSTGKVLWSDNNFVTEERMPRAKVDEKMAYADVVSKNVNRFIYRAFYRQNKKR